MNFSSLVLMEKDKESNILTKELGSYEVGEGAEYIIKFYYENGIVNVCFDTNVDVEDWEYTAIYDFFNEDVFISKGYQIESLDDEYNPAWRISFEYDDEYDVVHNKINELCTLFQEEIRRVLSEIKDKASEYK